MVTSDPLSILYVTLVIVVLLPPLVQSAEISTCVPETVAPFVGAVMLTVGLGAGAAKLLVPHTATERIPTSTKAMNFFTISPRDLECPLAEVAFTILHLLSVHIRAKDMLHKFASW
jgi:hypothetical protein